MKKYPLTPPGPMRSALSGLSKNALLDLYVRALSRANGHADDDPTLEEVRDDANPLLRARRDRLIK